MTELDEVKQILVYKIPMFLLGTAIGLGIVWVALMVVPDLAMNAVSDVVRKG